MPNVLIEPTNSVATGLDLLPRQIGGKMASHAFHLFNYICLTSIYCTHSPQMVVLRVLYCYYNMGRAKLGEKLPCCVYAAQIWLRENNKKYMPPEKCPFIPISLTRTAPVSYEWHSMWWSGHTKCEAGKEKKNAIFSKSWHEIKKLAHHF